MIDCPVVTGTPSATASPVNVTARAGYGRWAVTADQVIGFRCDDGTATTGDDITHHGGWLPYRQATTSPVR